MSNYMPNIEDVYRNKTQYIKEMETYLENLKKEKEKIIMSNTANLGKSFAEKLKEGSTNFVNWTSAMTTILNNRNELKDNLDALKEFDSALTDLKKVSEETVKVATGM